MKKVFIMLAVLLMSIGIVSAGFEFYTDSDSTHYALSESGGVYQLIVDGDGTNTYYLMFDDTLLGTPDTFTGIYWTNYDTDWTNALLAYYAARWPAVDAMAPPRTGYEWYDHLQSAAAGSAPFAYVATGTDVKMLLDGAQHAAGNDVPVMLIPGDFVCGSYELEGGDYSYTLVIGQDTDDDGIVDCLDAYPYDKDNDGVDDTNDNCPEIVNTDQADLDLDDIGDVCDDDIDGDGYLNEEDCNDYNPDVNPGAEEVCDTIDNDCDGTVDQHVCNWFCAETIEDTPTLELGVNRHIYQSGDYFTTLISKKAKGKDFFYPALSEFSLEDTNGCSCSQILTQLNEYNPVMYGNMLGHLKYGCSKSVMDEFVRLIDPIIEISMCEKDPDNDWQCKEYGAEGSWWYFAKDEGTQIHLLASGLLPETYYQVEAVDKGEDCSTWIPLTDNSPSFYGMTDGSGDLDMTFDVVLVDYTEVNLKNAEWANTEGGWVNQPDIIGYGYVLYSVGTAPLQCVWTS